MEVNNRICAEGPGFILGQGESVTVVRGEVIVLPVQNAEYRVVAGRVGVVSE